MSDEVVRDERILNPEQAFKTTTHIPALDNVLVQWKNRFSDETVDIMIEMRYFTPVFFSSEKPDVTGSQTKTLCSFYNMNTAIVVRGLIEFCPLYRKMHAMINADNLMPKATPEEDRKEDNGAETDDEVSDDEERCNDSVQFDRCVNKGFIKPLRTLTELSGISTLNLMYKILVSLAISSSSAERAMSRVRLIKNHNKTRMLDDWFSSLMILTSEKDILHTIPVDRIIDQFVMTSQPLAKLLTY